MFRSTLLATCVLLLASSPCVVSEVKAKKVKKTEVFTSSPDLMKNAQKVDLPYIACEVCNEVLFQLYNETKGLRKASPDNKVAHSKIKSMVKKVCDYEKREGRWISHYDIIEKDRVGGVALKLEKHPVAGQCEVECETIGRSCLNLVETEVEKDSLVDDLMEDSLSLEEWQKKVCVDDSMRCTKSGKARIQEEGRRKDYAYKARSDEAKTYDKIMDAFADYGVMGNDDGSTAPDIMDRFDAVMRMLEETGEL